MLTLVTGNPWAQAYLDLVEKGLELGDMPSKNTVWLAYLKDLGFKKYVIENTCPDCYSIEDFCADNPVGEYVIATGSHVVYSKDGFYFDSWNSGGEVPIFYLRR